METRKQRPRVLVITHFFPPEPCAAANRVAALTRGLDESGFDVHVVAAVASFPTGVIRHGDAVILPRTIVLDRVTLTRVWTFASQKLSGRARVLNWLSVALSATAFVLSTGRRFDIVIVSLPPISLALPALIASVRYRAKLVVDVRDVFPDVAVKMGYWRRDAPIARFVGAVSATLYRAARLVIAVTKTSREEIVARGSDDGKTIVASNGFDPIVLAKSSPYKRIENEFVAVFVGNMGLATGLEVIIDAAALLRDEPRMRFVMAGGGADHDRLATRIRAENLQNITMLGVISRAEANALIAAADVSIVPLHRSIVDSLPTKLFDALVLGCPIICCAEGEARAFVENSGGGLAVAPEDGVALASALRACAKNPGMRETFASRGRAYVIEHYDRKKIMRSVANTLLAL